MSIVNQDKKVLQDGRKETLETPVVPLRDQIPEKLAQRLEKKDIGTKVEELWAVGNSNRAEWLNKQRIYLKDVDEFSTATDEGPFAGSSNLHIPLSLSVLKTYHARMMEALLLDNGVNTKARNHASIDRVPLVQDTMIYALQRWSNHGDGVEAEVDDWIWEGCGMGSAILKDAWKKEYDWYTDVEEVEEIINEETMDGEGNPIVVPMPLRVEREVVKKELCFDGPIKRRVDHGDLVFVGGKGDIKRADAIIETHFMTASELWTLVDTGVFRKEAVRTIIDAGPDSESGEDHSFQKQDRAENSGIANIDSENKLDRYAIREAYLKIDVTDSGINSNVVVWTHPRTRALCRATYLRRVSNTGEVPYSKVDFLRRPGQDYGVGLLEMLHPLQVEMNAMHNLRVDFGMLATMPVGFYRATSSLNPETLRLEPGALIPVDNPHEDIVFPNLGNRTAFGLQEEAGIQTMVERLVNMNDLAFGVMTGAQGATRTATGARALQAESNTNLNVFLRRFRRAWSRSLRYMFSLIQERIPDGLAFRITGEDGSDYWRQVKNREDLQGDFDFEISANSADSNPQIAIQKSATVLQEMRDPLAIQLGIVTPGNYYEAKKDHFRSIGVRNYGRYLTKPPEHVLLLSPEEEVNRVLRGYEVPVTLQGDHEGFVAYVDFIMSNDHLLAQYSPDQVFVLEAQKRRHQQMAVQMQELQAQQANQSQIQANSQLSTSLLQSPQLTPTLAALGGAGEAA